ncbi:hypothetical protein ScPMuIL_007827 [Solemya velum]
MPSYKTERNGVRYDAKGVNIDPNTGLYKVREYKPSEPTGRMKANDYTSFRQYDPKATRTYTNKDIKEYTGKDIKTYDSVRTYDTYREYVLPTEESKAPKIVPKKKEKKEKIKPKEEPKPEESQSPLFPPGIGNSLGTVKRSLWLSSQYSHS